MTKTRNSSVELMKICGMFMIVLSHVALTMNDVIDQNTLESVFHISDASLDFNSIILRLFAYFGYVGNAIFFVCSSWYLCEAKEIKKEKIWQIIVDVWIISIIIMLAYLISPTRISLPYILKSLFPNLLSNNWYITCYLIFYSIVPNLNKALHLIEKKKFEKTIITILFLYFGIGFVLPNNFQTNYLVMFVVIHSVVFYFKKNMKHVYENKSINLLFLFVSSFSLLLLIIVLNLLGLRIRIIESKMMWFANFQNPFIIMVALSLLFISLSRSFYNKYVNLVSGLSLYIYVIHENLIFKSYTRLKIGTYLLNRFGNENVIVIAVLFAVTLFVITAIISMIYQKTIYLYTRRFSLFVLNCYDVLLNRIVSFFQGSNNQKED